MNRTFSEGSRRLWRDTAQPLTNSLIVASVVLFLCDFMRLPVSRWLDCLMPNDFLQPWRLLTYSLLSHGSILSLIFSGLLLWWVGGSLERGWGAQTFGLFYAAISVVTAAAFAVASLLFHGPIGVPGFLVLGALLVGWCVLNPDETIRLYGIIPIKTRYLAVGECAITFFSYGMQNPIVGLLALSGAGFAVLWVRNGWHYGLGTLLPFAAVRARQSPARRSPLSRPNLRIVPPKSNKPKDDRFTLRDLNPFEWLARRKRRKQFEKLINDD